MSQPIAMSAAVPKPYSSAPSSAAMTTSRPVCRPPSVRSATRSRRLVAHEDLVDLGEAELPRHAHVLDRGQRAGAGAAGVAADLDVVGPRLGDAGGDGADAHRRDELHADARAGVDRAQVGDELREVLDRVDVVVRRRADERDARLRAPQRAR